MSVGEFTLSIDKAQLAELTPVTYTGSVVMVNTSESIDLALDHLRKVPIVGFDTETRPSFKKGDPHNPSLMQISDGQICFLFRLCRTGLTPALREWLEDPRLLKVGLSLKDDFHQLRRLADFEPQGFIELQQLVRQYHIADASLSRIFAIIFGRRISKKQRLTNWEAPQLTLAQQHYAALDAWACLEIHKALTQGLFDADRSPYRIVADTESPAAL